MQTTTTQKLSPKLSALVNPAASEDGTIVSLIERESIEYDLNENQAEYDRSESARVETNPTTEETAIECNKARAGDNEALELFGIVDSNAKYQRGTSRTWSVAEVWHFNSDEITAEPDMVDQFWNVRWNVGDYTKQGNGGIISLDAAVHGPVYLNTDPLETGYGLSYGMLYGV